MNKHFFLILLYIKDFQAIVGKEAEDQFRQLTGGVPDHVVA